MTRSLLVLLLLAGLFVGANPLANAQSGWVPTGSLTTGRYGHTATLLPNGKVLVVGGYSLSSAELYDPATGTWTPTGSLATGRLVHTATLLPNGKVLVAGGEDGVTSRGMSSAELYEPATGIWTPTGSLATPRDTHTATLLPSGKVLVAGGRDFVTLWSSAELYDPATGIWATTGSLSTARFAHTATLLSSGKVVVAGGGGPDPSSAELYDPASGTWAATGSLVAGRYLHSATLLSNGKVLVAGGPKLVYSPVDPNPSLSSAELYNPASGTWTTTGALAAGRDSHTATLLPSGLVLAAGGMSEGVPLSSSELHDAGSGTWMSTGSLATARRSHTATLLPSGKVLVAGGADASLGALSSAELYGLFPVADLTITKTDGQTTASPGQTITFTITGTNAGPTAANGVRVADTLPAALMSPTWTCVAAGGASCTAGPSGGNINDLVNLPVSGTVTYTLIGQLASNAKGLSNTATITLPQKMFDPNLADNTATDTDLLVCSGEKVLVPDGRVTMSTIGAGATQWFGAGLKIGDSYSLEFANTQVDTPVSSVPPGALTVYSGDDGCSGMSTLAFTDTTANDPTGSGAAIRLSFAASGISPFFRAKLVNGSAGAILYTVAWSDTTMYSPAWSTNASFDTYYSIANTTGTTLDAVLMLLDASGSVSGTAYLTIPAGQKASANTLALGITRNRTGTARLTHNGPPGAAIVQAAIASFSLAPPYAQDVRFETVREAR